MRQFNADNWFTATPETAGARGIKMAEPYDKIFIGCDPLDGMTKEVAESFHAIINVSCTPCAYFNPAYPGQYMHWFPVNEMGYWGYTHLFYIKQVLDFHYEKGHKVYLHCHAGAYRSPSAAMLWLMSKGHTIEEAYCICKNNPDIVDEYKNEKDGSMWKYVANRWFSKKHGNVPDDFMEFFKRYNNTLARAKTSTHVSIADVLLSNNWIANTPEVFGSKRIRRLHWRRMKFPWYYKTKSYIDERKVDFNRFMLGQKFTPIKPGSRSGSVEDDTYSKMYKFREWLTPKVRNIYVKLFRGY